jgi:hypothetical protein
MSYEDAGRVPRRGGALTRPSPARVRLVESAQQSVAFDLSPDGTRVAWFKPPSADVQGSELWVAPVDGGTGVGGDDGARIAPASTIQGETRVAVLVARRSLDRVRHLREEPDHR